MIPLNGVRNVQDAIVMATWDTRDTLRAKLTAVSMTGKSRNMVHISIENRLGKDEEPNPVHMCPLTPRILPLIYNATQLTQRVDSSVRVHK